MRIKALIGYIFVLSQIKPIPSSLPYRVVLVSWLFTTVWGTTTPTFATSTKYSSPPHNSKTNVAAIASSSSITTLSDPAIAKSAAETLRTLDDEADSFAGKHDFPRSEQLHDQAFQFAQATFGADSIQLANENFNFGWFWADMANYPKAEDYFQKCYDIRSVKLGLNSSGIAEIYNAQADLAEDESDPTKAEALYKKAIAIEQNNKGLKSIMLAQYINNLATLYSRFGSYELAEDNFDRALSIREERLGPQSLSVATTLNNLALLDLTLGNLKEAKALFERVLTIRKARLGESAPFTASTMCHLGLVYSQLGDMQQAEQLLQEASKTRQTFYGNNHPEVAQSLYFLAVLYDEEGHFEKAEPNYLAALRIQQAQGEDNPDYAKTLCFLGHHDHLQGKFNSALPLYQAALAIQQKKLGPDHPETVKTEEWLADLELDLGNNQEAERIGKEVVASKLATINGVFHFAPEDQRMGFDHGAGLCDLPASTGDAASMADTILRAKGIVLDSILEDRTLARRNGVPWGKTPEPATPLQSAAPQALNQGSSEDAQVADRMEQVAWVEQILQGEKTRRSLSVEADEVQDQIPSDAALVEYVTYNRYTGRLQSEPSIGAVILTKDNPPVWVPLGDQASLKDKIQDYQHDVRRRVHETLFAEVLRGLENRLIAPLQAHFPANIHRLIISPDGEMNFLSFATLLDEQNRFLAQDYSIEYVASGRDLLRDTDQLAEPALPAPVQGPFKGQHDAPTLNFVILAEPNYNRLGGVSEPDGYFSPLPGTGEEASFLAAEANRRGWTATVLDGDKATKQNLFMVDSPFVLHLASHALFVGAESANEWHIKMGSGDDGQPTGRGFLALAGANVTVKNWESSPENGGCGDGMLSGEEVGSLKLNGTWLVTLSACDTGCGEALTGEGVLGLRRGFTEAGAQNLLLTLWPISDTETADLMKAFYQKALTTKNAAEALAETQRDALVSLRQKRGLTAAVWKAGPFILSY